MRTQDDILLRIKMLEGDDILGFQREVLINALTFDNVRPFLKDGVTREEWDGDEGLLADDDRVRTAAKGYMAFAWGKVEDHRGISASRSVSKMRSYVWLLGDDEVLVRYDDEPYAPYGAPQLRYLCEHYHWPIPETETVRRMSEGSPCSDDCYDGCMS